MVIDAKRYLESLLDQFADEQARCIKSLLDGDHASARKAGLRLCPEHPQYLLLCLFMDIPENKRLFLLLLKKVAAPDLSLVSMLVNDPRFSLSEIADVVSRLEGDSFMHTVVRRDWFLRSRGFSGGRDAGAVRGASEEEAAQINSLIDTIDDFRLYQYAMQNNLAITERSSINYKWYRVLAGGDQSTALDMIRKSTDFNDISEISRAAGLSTAGVPSLDVLLCYLHSGYSEDLLLRMVRIFAGDRSFVSHKVLLALLIASRKESSLVLALYISFCTAFDDNYEIDLIHLFLNRYFCFVGSIQRQMQRLDVKNIQAYNNAYVWSDPMIVAGDSLSSSATILNKSLRNDLHTVESRLRGFLDANRVGHAASLLELQGWLRENTAVREVNESRILATTGETAYSTLLGGPCRYLFDKLTAGHQRSGYSCLGSLFSHPDGTPVSSVLKNPYMPIECPNFLRYFHSHASKTNKTVG